MKDQVRLSLRWYSPIKWKKLEHWSHRRYLEAILRVAYTTTQDSPFHCLTASRIFVHAPQYHWHAAGAKGVYLGRLGGDTEHIVSDVNLLDRFGRQTELREEELWARSERLAEGSSGDVSVGTHGGKTSQFGKASA